MIGYNIGLLMVLLIIEFVYKVLGDYYKKMKLFLCKRLMPIFY